MTDKCPYCGAEMPAQAGGGAICPVCGEARVAEAPMPAAPFPSAQPPAEAPAPDHPQAAPLSGDQSKPESPAPPMEPPTEPTGYSPPPFGAADDQFQAPPAPPRVQPPADAMAYAKYSPAWEGDDPLLKGLWRTIWSVLLHPVKSFRAPALPGQAWALSFGLILGVFGMAMQALWSRVFNQPDMIPMSALWWLLLSPLAVLAGLYLNAGLTHLGLIMVGGAKRGFTASLRVVGYSEAAAIFYVVPFVGMAVAGVWGLVILIGGLAGAHGISGWRVVWAYVLLLIIFAAVIAIIVLIVGTGMVLGILGQLAGKGSML